VIGGGVALRPSGKKTLLHSIIHDGFFIYKIDNVWHFGCPGLLGVELRRMIKGEHMSSSFFPRQI
jgi:hypothetical protein